MKVHPEILGPSQHRVLGELGPLLTPLKFYLGGGTALALQFGHRRSVDLDWFALEMPDEPEYLAERLREAGVDFTIKLTAPNTLHGRVGRVQVSLLRYHYPMLRPLLPARKWGCRLASCEDLAAMKLAAAADRGAKKDFVDLFALLHKQASLQEMLDWFQRKYSVEDITHVLCSLTYFDDADEERMPRMLWDVNWRIVKKQMRQWVQEWAG